MEPHGKTPASRRTAILFLQGNVKDGDSHRELEFITRSSFMCFTSGSKVLVCFPEEWLFLSFSSSVCSEDQEAIQAQKIWKKAIMLVWRAAANHR